MIKVAISFAEKDKELASQIANGLIGHGILVVSEISIEDKILNWGKSHYELVDRNFDSSVEYCIVLLSEDFYRYNWKKGYYKEILLNKIIEREGFILPVIINDNKLIPKILKSRSSISIRSDEFQTIIDSFISKISVTEKINNKEIESYEDLNTILTLFNSKLKINKVSSNKDRIIDKKIGFDIYTLSEPVKNLVTYYVVYLYKGATLKNTIKYIQSNYSKIFGQLDKLIILFPIENNQKDLSRRKENISTLFGTDACFYIKDFIWKYCTPPTFTESFEKQPLDNFIPPNIHTNEEEKATDYILNWLFKDYNPILVLRGIGGIGKTTTAKWFTNYIHDKIPNTKAIFIDSIETIKYLKRRISNNYNDIDLYSFYEADYENRKSKLDDITKLKSEEFKCNLDNGNIILIIDGLDEVISKLENNFNTSAFFDSVYSFSNQFGKGKVIITCRNYFWDLSDTHKGISTAELLPFNKELARKYFSFKYPKNLKLVEKGLEMASSLTIKNNVINSIDSSKEEEFIPYVLDMTSYIIDSKQNYEGIIEDIRFDSRILSLDVDNDYIIYKICQREMKKLNQVLDVDQQIDLFTTISNNHNGYIKSSHLKILLEDCFSYDINDDVNDDILNTFKAHPILRYNKSNDLISFRYDLLNDYFQNVYLTGVLSNKIPLDINNIKCFNQLSKYGSQSMKNVCNRITITDDDQTLINIEILDQINKLEGDNRKSLIQKKKATAEFFNYLLFTNHNKKSNDIESNTSLLKDYFVSQGNIINNLSINNLTSTYCNNKIVFDFSDLVIVNSTFSNYEYFGYCKFNNFTLFENCKFEDLHLSNLREYNFKTNNFKNSHLDENIKCFLKSLVKTNKSNKINIQEDLIDFLGLFCGKGRTTHIKEKVLKNKYKPKAISFNQMIKCLIKNNILSKYRLNSFIHYEIEENQRYDIINFVQQDKMSITIKNTFDHLIKNK